MADETNIGPQGPQGIRGPQGEPGVAGPAGEPGSTGPQGIRGIRGKDGTKWHVGYDDPTDDIGDDNDFYLNTFTGAVFGPKNKTGDFTSSWNLDEYYILKGDDGAGFYAYSLNNLDPNVTLPVEQWPRLGSSIVDVDSWKVWTLGMNEQSAIVWTLKGNIKGATGAQGPAGPTGPKGDKGDTGAQGLQGIQGVQGPKGDKGDAGSQGIQGPAGPAGQDGADGIQGLQGPPGEDGLPGDMGPTGPKGDKGDQGDPGPQGPKGDKGDQGDVGPEGPQGIQGPPGSGGVSSGILHRFDTVDYSETAAWNALGTDGDFLMLVHKIGSNPANLLAETHILGPKAGGVYDFATAQPITPFIGSNNEIVWDIDSSAASGQYDLRLAPINTLQAGVENIQFVAPIISVDSKGRVVFISEGPALVPLSGGTVASTVFADLALGEPAIDYTSDPDRLNPCIATINGHSFTFNRIAAGGDQYFAPYSLEEDMAYVINAANLPDIKAYTASNELHIVETTGQSITIVNVSGPVFAGPNSASGLPLFTKGVYLPSGGVDGKIIGHAAGKPVWVDPPAGGSGEPGPQGEPGPAGADGQDGADGAPGADGLSAYQIAVNNGFVGDEEAWLASLVGPQGEPGEGGSGGGGLDVQAVQYYVLLFGAF